MVATAETYRAPSALSQSATPTSESELSACLDELKNRATEFARLSPSMKAALLRECMPRVADVAEEWVRGGTKAKGLPAHETAEEWLAGPTPTMRMLRLLASSLDVIERHGRPPFGRKHSVADDGRVRVDVFPSSAIDGVLFAGFSGHVWLEEGLTPQDGISRQAEFYQRRDPEGAVSLILGAGNVSSIPPMDFLTKMFIEGFVCIVKMNPVNEWVGPCLQRAFAPLIARQYLRIVYGGAEQGAYLSSDERVDDIHITGSDKTHDAIVWGADGAERERRKAANDPVLRKPITSELGNVSPVCIVPYDYSDAELRFQAKNLVSMVANNASFNCNAAKLVVTAKGWPQRDRFMSLVEDGLRRVPTRSAYYPGAFERYESLTRGRDVTQIGTTTQTDLAWTLIRDVDADDKDDLIFSTEPFCSILSQTEIDSTDPGDFLRNVSEFLNDRVWGTLNACIIIHPKLEADASVRRELDGAIRDLRYGTVAINCWPAVCYGATTMPWGGHPSATLANIQSGLGWVHNTFMLGGIEKSVIRGPIKAWPEPVWYAGNRFAADMGSHLVALEKQPSWVKVPALMFRAFRG